MNEAEVRKELAEHGNRVVRLEVSIVEILAVASMVQLAARHPRAPAKTTATVRQVIETVSSGLADLCPNVAELIELGWTEDA